MTAPTPAIPARPAQTSLLRSPQPAARSAAPLPALFVPHGAPTFALAPGAAGAALTAAAARLPRPRAIVVVSAHWQTAEPVLGVLRGDGGTTAHDFSGFPQSLHDIDYPAHGDAAVAETLRAALAAAGFAARVSSGDRLDHGAWIPLRLMYPQADIPVVPLSLQLGRGPEHHHALGRALAGLSAGGILLVASGNLTHNLRDYRSTQGRGESSGDAPAYVAAFADWIAARLAAHDTDALFAYRRQAPEAARAHPSEEHLLPLFVALGAAGNDWHAERLYSGIDDHVLAMDSFALWPATGGNA